MNYGLVDYSKRKTRICKNKPPKLGGAIIPFIFLLTLVLISTKAFGGKLVRGKVLDVLDGDTIIVRLGGQRVMCRLYGIDAPEVAERRIPGQPFGDEAMNELRKLVLLQTVDIELTGEKIYKRNVCLIKKDGMDINLEMVKRGYAWAFRRYLKEPYASEYIQAENEAKKKWIGLWRQLNPQPPWEFRRRQINNIY